MLKQIPCYFYEGENQLCNANINLIMDSEFVSKFSNYTSTTQLYSWAGIHETNLKKLINNYIQYNLISNYIPFWVGVESSYPPSDAIRAAIEISGIDVEWVTNVTPRTDRTHQFPNISIRTLNNCVASNRLGFLDFVDNDAMIPYRLDTGAPNINNTFVYNNQYRQITMGICVYSDNLFDPDTKVVQASPCALFSIYATLNSTFTEVVSARITVVYHTNSANYLGSQYNPRLNLNGAQDKDKDDDNPYKPYDDDDGGGDGDGGDPKETDPTPIPSLPAVTASDFITIYNPTSSVLNSLAGFLWSADNIFDINNFKKLYSDPSECLIGLSVLPCIPSASGQKNIKFGNIDTGINCQYFTSQWCEVDCGSLYVKSTVKSFMDYSPYVKCQIFLPYIGFQYLNPDEIMEKTLHVVYHVDIVSGDVVAFIEVSGRGVLYSYSGNCLCTIPVTGSSFGAFWNKYYSSLATVVPNMVGGGMMGGAAGAAMGGLNTLFNAAETVMLDQKPMYSRSGSMSGAAAIMGVQKPFIIIERPNISVPDYVQRYAGLSANKTMSLGSCSGFTQVDYVHIDGVTATKEEITEIENLLHQGVIL